MVPEPLEPIGDTVNYEFIRMPNSTGFGDYTETGQVIPVRFTAADGTVQEGGYVHAMYLDDNAPIAGGREIWGFPKKLAKVKTSHQSETIVCTLHFGTVLCVSATMGYKHRELDPAPILKNLAKPNFMIKIIPHVDCTPRICELVRYYCEDVTVKGAWTGPAAIELFEHALCDVARLPVREVVVGQPLLDRSHARPRRGGIRLSQGRLKRPARDGARGGGTRRFDVSSSPLFNAIDEFGPAHRAQRIARRPCCAIIARPSRDEPELGSASCVYCRRHRLARGSHAPQSDPRRRLGRPFSERRSGAGIRQRLGFAVAAGRFSNPARDRAV